MTVELGNASSLAKQVVHSLPGRGTLENMKMVQKRVMCTMSVSICKQYLAEPLSGITDPRPGITAFSLSSP